MNNAPESVFKFSPVLILSTGRCGSTMVSEILNTHPAILSLSEFFSALGNKGLLFSRPDGECMWKLYSRQSETTNACLRDGVVVDEILYPFAAPGSRFSPGSVPPILAVTLPHLTPDFETLYYQLEPAIRDRPAMLLADHYRFLFEHLGRRFGKTVWVERSGGSLMTAAVLLRLFPEARVIHVCRDGRDTAISMSVHHPFRVLVAMLKKLRRWGLRPTRQFLSPARNRLSVWLESFVFSRLNVMTLLRKHPPRLEDFGAFWSELELIGHDVLQRLPPKRLLKVKFEDIQNDPRGKISELLRFIDPSLEYPAWLEAASKTPRAARSKFKSLPPEQQESLTSACGPGLDLLGYPR
jgi:hypothetical protein